MSATATICAPGAPAGSRHGPPSPARLWRNRAHAALVLALLAGAGAVAPAAVRGGETLETGPILVTTSRVSTPLAASNRSVAVIGRGEIERSAARSVAELLERVAGVDLRTRGPLGVQADVSIRGATFEQTLVLVDGVRVSDPQTGHHLLDLPVTLDEIERIEIVKGQGSSLWGPNAFGGVINIITRRPQDPAVAAAVSAGEHGLRGGEASLAAPLGPAAGRLSLEKRVSDGWRHNTDFDLTTASLATAFDTGAGQARFAAGYAAKEFGANGFYSDRYPEQREATETTFLRGSADLGGARLSLAPGLYWRRHHDSYVLDDTVRGPGRYENHHTTDSYGLQAAGTVQTGAGSSAFGVELGGETIRSNRLGDHSRRSAGLSAEHVFRRGEAFDLRLGASAWHHSDWGWTLSPGADFSLRLGAGTRWFGAVERAYRVPTYTELYYASPANQGNPDLEPEKAWTWETGLRGAAGPLRWEGAAFLRSGSDLIDWTRERPEDPWKARNIGRVRTAGVDLGLGWLAPPASPGTLRQVRLDYAYLDSDKSVESGESRYALDHLRHQAVLRAGHRLPFAFAQEWVLRYERRLAGDDVVLVDTAIRRSWGRLALVVEARNLFDEDYSRVGGVPLPGRWVLARLEWSLAGGKPAEASAPAR